MKESAHLVRRHLPEVQQVLQKFAEPIPLMVGCHHLSSEMITNDVCYDSG